MEFNTGQVAIYLLSNALLVYNHYRVFNICFERTHINKKIESLCFIGYFCLNSITFLLINHIMLNLATTVIPLIAISFLYPTKAYIKLPVVFLSLAFISVVDIFVYRTLLSIGIASEIVPILGNILVAITAFFATLVLQKIRTPAHNHYINTLHWIAICLIPIGSIVVSIISFQTEGYDIAKLAVISCVLILTNVMVFILFDALGKYSADHYNHQLLQQQNQAYRDQFALMDQSEQQARTLRHDMKNHLTILRQYADDGRIKELEQYLDAFARNLSPKAEYVATGNRELDSILNYKLGQAEAAGATLTVNVSLPEQLEVDVFDLNVVLGNLLDNAIEGMAGSDNKELSLHLRLDRGVLCIKITNTYDGVVNIEHTANTLRYRTRKKDGALHGLGLESVKATINKYHGYLEINHQDRLFVVEAMLYLLEMKQ